MLKLDIEIKVKRMEQLWLPEIFQIDTKISSFKFKTNIECSKNSFVNVLITLHTQSVLVWSKNEKPKCTQAAML